MKKKNIIIKLNNKIDHLIKESNTQRVERINSSRKMGTQIIPNKKKLSRAQQKQRDYKEGI